MTSWTLTGLIPTVFLSHRLPFAAFSGVFLETDRPVFLSQVHRERLGIQGLCNAPRVPNGPGFERFDWGSAVDLWLSVFLGLYRWCLLTVGEFRFHMGLSYAQHGEERETICQLHDSGDVGKPAPKTRRTVKLTSTSFRSGLAILQILVWMKKGDSCSSVDCLDETH